MQLQNVSVSSLLYSSQLIRLWYLSHRRPAKAQVPLRIRIVSPEPSLFADIKYGSRRKVRPKRRCLALLEDEFMEDKKYHNLMRWLISFHLAKQELGLVAKSVESDFNPGVWSSNPSPATCYFHGDWSWKNFKGNSLKLGSCLLASHQTLVIMHKFLLQNKCMYSYGSGATESLQNDRGTVCSPTKNVWTAKMYKCTFLQFMHF